MASNLDILKIFNVRVRLRSFASSLCLTPSTVHREEGYRGNSVYNLPPHGTSRSASPGILQPCDEETRSSAHASSVRVRLAIKFALLRVYRLGITQHLIKSGIARLEEIRAKDGTLENLYVRVRILLMLLFSHTVTVFIPGRSRESTQSWP